MLGGSPRGRRATAQQPGLSSPSWPNAQGSSAEPWVEAHAASQPGSAAQAGASSGVPGAAGAGPHRTRACGRNRSSSARVGVVRVPEPLWWLGFEGLARTPTSVNALVSVAKRHACDLLFIGFYGVMVSTLDFESNDPGSSPGRTLLFCRLRGCAWLHSSVLAVRVSLFGRLVAPGVGPVGWRELAAPAGTRRQALQPLAPRVERSGVS